MATRPVVCPVDPGGKPAESGGARLRGLSAGARVSREELGNTGLFSLRVPGGAGCPCVCERESAKFSGVSVPARVWVCA